MRVPPIPLRGELTSVRPATDADAELTYLLQEAEPNRLTVDPYLWNKPAIHAWRKAGFRPVEERPPDGDHAEGWLLMTTEVKTAE